MAVDPVELLEPAGIPIGVEGSQPTIRELTGGTAKAEEIFNQLTEGATQSKRANYPGECCELPGGGWVGYRPVSKGGTPAIDIDIPEISIKKIHFL